jgi:hypothetical protein
MDNPQLCPASAPGRVKLSSGEKVLVIGQVTGAGKDARLILVRQAS